MQKRVHCREFKLDIVRQIESGQKQQSQVCQENSLHVRMVHQWRKEYIARGENAFLPQQSCEILTSEMLERKRAWDRNYYQRHKSERQAINAERRLKLYEYIQQIKANAKCMQCGENHPAALQFHHRYPSQKEFNVSEFATRQLGGMEKLKQEIEKCDIICANCHLKYHYEHSRRQAHLVITSTSKQFEIVEQNVLSTIEG